ncbi:DUF4062 domain-containing protein [Planococcus rifietoensis]|uniref:DUF4062 domain-containing protein n=1 Tax=Planococcus rifietoensis TaxID=200991 RepID=UPI00384DA688
MSYNAKVFNVMIASPNDVASERTIVRDVIYEWNAIHSLTRNIVLLPIGWETHSSPEMGKSPQDVINEQVALKCDLLIGVFWTRLGTPTNGYSSGTVEEIEKHLESEKPAMLYFSSQPVAMNSVDLEQYSELKKFQSSCQSRGLYEEYDSHGDFKQKFFHHLQLKLNEHILFKEAIDFENEIIESRTPLPKLSDAARILLKEASLAGDGNILYFRYLDGTDLQVNGKNLISIQDRREVSKWEEALNELLSQELIIERDNKGTVYEITNLGYQIADMIQF